MNPGPTALFWGGATELRMIANVAGLRRRRCNMGGRWRVEPGMAAQNECALGPGKVVPVVNRERCENKGPCVDVCPYGVFTIHALAEVDKRRLSWKGRVRLWAHGGQQAHASFAERCEGCGLCVAACPEKAITLQRVG